MPTARRTHAIAAAPTDVWAVVSDPEHLPRWWPRVQRVEGVDPERWTMVLVTDKGKPVRADFRLLESRAPSLRSWRQELEGSPFERVLADAVTVLRLEPGGPDETNVTLELQQQLRGMSRLGGLLAKRSSGRLLDQALDGLAGACER